MDNTAKYMPVRATADDPCRCIGKGQQGAIQCIFRATAGSPYCPMHQSMLVRDSKGALYKFDSVDAKIQVEGMRDHPESFRLVNEVAMARVMLQTIYNDAIKTPFDMAVKIPTLQPMIKQVESLVLSCLKVEEKVGSLLSVEQVAEVAQTLLVAISQHVQDVDVLENIALDFEFILNSIGSQATYAPSPAVPTAVPAAVSPTAFPLPGANAEAAQ